jgi:hypothetical protein
MTVVFTVSMVVAAIWCLLAIGAVALGTCGGDGGEPYAEAGSVAQQFCDGPLHSALPVALAVAIQALHLLGVSRSLQTGRWTTVWRWLACAYLGVALYTVPAFLPTS